MNTPSKSKNTLGAAVFAAALVSPLAAASETYDTVIGKLDTGGQFLGYMDVSQDPEQFVSAAQSVFEAVKAADPSIPPIPLDLSVVIGRLGVFGLDAMGASSVQEENGQFLNKTYFYFPNGREGLFKMSGGEPHELSIAGFAPADAALAIEADLDLTCLRDVAMAIATDVMGPAGEGIIAQTLSQPMGPIAWTWNDLIDHADTRLALVASIDESLPGFEIEDGKVTLPAFDFVLSLDGFGDLLDLVSPMAEGSGQAAYVDTEAYDMLQAIEELPPEMQHLRPVVARLKATNQLLIASRVEYLDTCLGDGPKLAASPDFQRLTKGFPSRGNALTYVSKDVVDRFSEIMQANAASDDPKAAAVLAAIQQSGLFRFTGGASFSANEAEGVFTLSREDSSYKSKILAAPIAFAAISAAIAVPTIGKIRENQEEGMYEESWDEGSGEEGMYEEGEYEEGGFEEEATGEDTSGDETVAE